MDVCGFCGGAAMVSRTWWRGRRWEGHGQAWYEMEFRQLHRESSVLLFRQKAALSSVNSSSSCSAGGETAKELASLATTFLARVAPSYLVDLSDLVPDWGPSRPSTSTASSPPSSSPSAATRSAQGHGGSDGLHGYVQSLDHAIQDMKMYLKKFSAQNPGVPCFCIGTRSARVTV